MNATTTDGEDDQKTTTGIKIWRRRCGQQDTSKAGGRWSTAAARNRDGWGRILCLWPTLHPNRVTGL